MTTDEHFEAAVRGTAEVAQKATQPAHAMDRREPQAELVAHEKTPALPGFADSCDFVQPPEMAGTGFELATAGLRAGPSTGGVLAQAWRPVRKSTFAVRVLPCTTWKW